jgi:hypothetical protein
VSYWLSSFDSLAIPTALGTSGRHQLSATGRESPLMFLPGGQPYDPLGTDRATRKATRITAEVLLVASTPAALRTALDAWLAKVGKRGTLVRADDAGNQQTVTALLVDAQASRQVDNILHLPLTLNFDVLSPCWSGAAHIPTVTLATTSATVIPSPNDGNARVTNPILTVTAVTSAITLVEVAQSVTGGQVSWYWAGTLAAGKSLVIDCGALSVKNDGVDAYSGFALYPTHTVDEWLRIESGANTPTVKRTGGGATSTASLSYADGWA